MAFYLLRRVYVFVRTYFSSYQSRKKNTAVKHDVGNQTEPDIGSKANLILILAIFILLCFVVKLNSSSTEGMQLNNTLKSEQN